MNKLKLTEDVVLLAALALITTNGSTTTLDVKRQLRRDGTYEAFQQEISTMMQNLFSQDKLASTNDPSRSYQTYTLPVADDSTATNAAKLDALGKAGVAAVIKDLLENSQNQAVLEILTTLTTQPKVTRKEIVSALTLVHNANQVTDSALSSLLKKGIIVRIGRGEYEAANLQKDATTSQPADDGKASATLHNKIQDFDPAITLEGAVQKMLNYSFEPVDWTYVHLSSREKSILNEKEFDLLKTKYKK